MSAPMLMLIAVGLAMDAFAVSIATGLAVKEPTFGHVSRVAFSFGLFQFMMAVIGWYAGSSVAVYIEAWDHWIAFALLAAIGGKMLVEAFQGERKAPRTDPTRGWMLITLSIATSIDALAVGLGLAFLKVSIWLASIVIGVVAAGLSVVGVMLGRRIGPRWERWAEVAGGVVLIAIGVKVLLEHTCGWPSPILPA